MNLTTLVALALIATLAACVQVPPEPQTPDTCNSAQWANLIGADASAADNIPEPKRIIPPNSAVTMDYRETRTNVDLDGAGTIIRIWCG